MRYNGESLLSRALLLARRVSPQVILVAGRYRQQTEALARGFPGVITILNSWYAEGLFSSIQRAVPYVKGFGAYILLPDLPLLTADHFFRLPVDGSCDAARFTFSGTPAHPVYLSPRVLWRARSFPVRGAMQDVLQLYDVRAIDTRDPAVVTDVDTQLDYQRLLSHARTV